ncbi:hypothetical protein ABMA28_009578 [Loxostege sticticalis]|uniref:Uncharacterized protein n=1 Tax=Loxostege sticticalis TaxID=481309 RepID=A0ABD0SDV4_LOXSC
MATAKIIPKPGKDNYQQLSSFRPIGLINVFGKLLERLINNRLIHHLESTHSSASNQYGFKNQKSTVLAINSALDIIRTAKTNGEQVIAVSLDIRAAFDRAWWPAIFRRLRDVNCPRNIYLLLLSYVQDREVQIQFADCRVTKFMSRGCIQGSVIGPTMWNLILDDLLTSAMPIGCKLQAYADDVLLIAHADNNFALECITNQALDQISKWGQGVKLEFGPEKTQIIAFTHRAIRCKIHMGTQNLKFTKQIKYLGIVIDNKLRFNQHAEYAIMKAKKIFNRMSLFIRPTWGVHPGNVKTIYEQVIEPIISYGAGIWHPALDNTYVRERLLSLQRSFAVKIIQGFRTISTAASITLAGLTPLPDKVSAVADIEKSKLLGVSSFLPGDVPIESFCPPSELPHPTERGGIEFTEVSSATDLAQMAAENTWFIYTDGSKHDDRVGAAFVLQHSAGNRTTARKKFKLHDCCSVYQAELLAIREACAYSLQNLRTATKVIIISDCKSALLELQNACSRNRFAVSIQKSISQARSVGIAVELAWIKAHVGFSGNEEADEAAKSAANLHKALDHGSIPISHIKLLNKQKCIKASEQLYSKTANCAYTKNLLPTYDNVIEYLKHVTPNFAITQFLTGHGYTKQYLHRFKISATDTCPCDGTTIQNFQHLLEDCPRFAIPRYNHTTLSHSYNLDPYNLLNVITKESTLNSFHNLITHIVKELKNFNKT